MAGPGMRGARTRARRSRGVTALTRRGVRCGHEQAPAHGPGAWSYHGQLQMLARGKAALETLPVRSDGRAPPLLDVISSAAQMTSPPPVSPLPLR